MRDVYSMTELFEITGCKSATQLVVYLQEKNIPFHRRGKSQNPWTTIQAFNQSLGVAVARQRQQTPANDVVLIK